jgi:hypothetical protein
MSITVKKISVYRNKINPAKKKRNNKICKTKLIE